MTGIDGYLISKLYCRCLVILIGFGKGFQMLVEAVMEAATGLINS